MPVLRPPPPASADRCTQSDGLQRCKNLRLRSKPFCRHHLPVPKINKKKKPRARVPVAVRVSSPKVADLLRQVEPPKSPNPGEIWAVAHESDGIPRSYARIDRIGICPEKSTAEITRLDFHPISAEDLLFTSKDLPISCGTYRAKNSPELKEISALCHRIGKDEDFRVPETRSFYTVFPRKGEIWAVYRECDGSERTPLFRIVEVLEGFSENEGVVAVGLEAESQMKFRREQKEGVDSVVKFSKMELLLFSHRITGIMLASKGGDGGRGEV